VRFTVILNWTKDVPVHPYPVRVFIRSSDMDDTFLAYRHRPCTVFGVVISSHSGRPLFATEEAFVTIVSKKMPLVAYSCSASAPAILALKVLAKVQDAHVEFSEVPEFPSVKIVTTNVVLGSSNTMSSVSWLGCARNLSQIVPSLGLWDDPNVEIWVESAITLVVSTLESTGEEL
jgi:hypothetical protein